MPIMIAASTALSKREEAELDETVGEDGVTEDDAVVDDGGVIDVGGVVEGGGVSGNEG